MSIICTFFVFFLCLSMHACNARNLGVVDKVQLKAESIQGRSGANGEKIDHDMQVKAGTGATSQNKQKDTYIGGEIPGLVPVKPFVSVSRMPRKNLHDEHPGFYSDDYSRPRTRPPSHN
ncbi:hypothetical protein CIPAW_03G093700 [Carya illinoinensis]|uniref:Uncharacterized protein n=1 Tax=Carya illinoinensis TaxID=32201 RepID=A0A8T1QYS6_CARIL|nr:hypothetical protein CIPAW_03G093700 [Carya illinoinensis]